jgi:hypothetical protein
MILAAHQESAAAGRVTDAERQSARGHAALAVCIESHDPEVAWALERRLFDHGYSVHVIYRPENLSQAVRTALEAGLVAIVPAADAAALQDVERVAHAATVRYTVERPAPEAARSIWQDLENSGKLDRKTGPLTGGAGI